MTNQKVIELETKVRSIQIIISNWKQEISQYEKLIIPALIEEINKLKKQTNNNENMKITNQNNALEGEINTK